MTMTMTKTGEKSLTVTRRFKAPPERIYNAHLDARLVQQWMLGPEGWTMPHCDLDGRPGGAFSYTWQSAEGESFTIRGTFAELDPPHRIVHTEVMDMGEFQPESRVVTTFEPDGTGTLMTMVITYDSAEARQGAIDSGMEFGMAVTYDRLDALG